MQTTNPILLHVLTAATRLPTPELTTDPSQLGSHSPIDKFLMESPVAMESLRCHDPAIGALPDNLLTGNAIIQQLEKTPRTHTVNGSLSGGLVGMVASLGIARLSDVREVAVLLLGGGIGAIAGAAIGGGIAIRRINQRKTMSAALNTLQDLLSNDITKAKFFISRPKVFEEFVFNWLSEKSEIPQSRLASWQEKALRLLDALKDEEQRQMAFIARKVRSDHAIAKAHDNGLPISFHMYESLRESLSMAYCNDMGNLIHSVDQLMLGSE